MRTQDLSIATLFQQSTADLIRAWTEVVGKAPRCAGSREFLLLGLAWHLQAHQLGGLSSALRRRLTTLGKATRTENPAAFPNAHARFKSGTVLTKDWQGRRHTVMVQDRGFAYAGQTYQSLSEVARLITGTRWNGPAFFGLRSEPRPKKKEEQKS